MATVVARSPHGRAVQSRALRAGARSKSLFIALALAIVASGFLGNASRALAFTSVPGRMQPGQTLTAGQYVAATRDPYRLTMQPDGNLVLDVCGRALWASKTGGNAGARAVMQVDGNLVVYSTANKALWQTKTANHPNAYLSVQNDGNIVIYSDGGSPYLWASWTVTNYEPLCGGARFSAGGSLTSPNGAYHLDMQTDGNLVLYETSSSKAVWASWTMNNPGAYAYLYGRLVVTLGGNQLWSSGVSSSADAYLAVTNFGNVDLISSHGTTLWRAAGLPKVGLPSWWGGRTCPTWGASTVPLATWAATGLIACGPGKTGDTTEFSTNPISVEKWQCVELSERWLFQEFKLPQQKADGIGVAPAYWDYIQAHPAPGQRLVYETPVATAPAIGPGDVISYSSSTDIWGHTAVVYQVTDKDYTIVSENWAGGYQNPFMTLPLVNGVPQAITGHSIVGWLHDIE